MGRDEGERDTIGDKGEEEEESDENSIDCSLRLCKEFRWSRRRRNGMGEGVVNEISVESTSSISSKVRKANRKNLSIKELLPIWLTELDGMKKTETRDNQDKQEESGNRLSENWFCEKKSSKEIIPKEEMAGKIEGLLLPFFFSYLLITRFITTSYPLPLPLPINILPC